MVATATIPGLRARGYPDGMKIGSSLTRHFASATAATETTQVVLVRSIDIEVEAGATVAPAWVQIVAADIGASAFVVDAETVAKTSDTNARPKAGMIRNVDASGVWVSIL